MEPTFSSLPSELLNAITNYLDKPSACALALTCSTLRPASEMVIWKSVYLTDKSIRPIVHARQPWESDSWARQSSSPAFSIPSGAKQVFATCLTLLQSVQWRSTSVRKLELDLRFDFPSPLQDILRCIGPSLESLTFRTPGPAFHMQHSVTATLDLFKTLRFHSLKQLKIDVNFRWNETLTTIAKAAPNLEVLHMYSHPRRIGGGPKTPSGGVSLPNLNELVIDEMEEGFVPTLVALVSSAPNLKRVVLRDHAHRWRPSIDNRLLVALGGSGITHFECTAAVLPHLLNGGFQSLEVLSMLWGTDLLLGNRKPDVLIPPLPKLHTYQLDISSYTSQSQFDLHHTLFSLPSLKQKAVDNPLDHFNQCPSLTSIHLPNPIDCFSRHVNIFDLPQETATTFKGIYATTYCKDGHELTHCRRRVPRDDLPDVFGAENWEEFARYQGVDVPLRVLGAVYATADIMLSDVKAERGKVLPDGAWAVLDRWMLQRECW